MKIKLDPHGIMPTRAHEADAGLDILSPESFVIQRGEFKIIKTGVHIELPPGTVGILKSKSGLSTKFDVHTVDGVVDEQYTGEILVKLHNAGNGTVHFRRGDKITQLVIVPCIRPELELVDELEKTERGDNGFGSTGR